MFNAQEAFTFVIGYNVSIEIVMLS